ncbi:hypothetical protein IEQ34_006325 [Dendrobium chrysotoxum]|uniref:Transmembrane protein n=1 Tax=Dendrobium chrysotoxum TaxID=161865 RepID=A0AAV7HCJ2_DENCH|nr:hypothetical protein IEQ34_006325 [Dendrobium chrysotoxum]
MLEVNKTVANVKIYNFDKDRMVFIKISKSCLRSTVLQLDVGVEFSYTKVGFVAIRCVICIFGWLASLQFSYFPISILFGWLVVPCELPISSVAFIKLLPMIFVLLYVV